MRGNTSDWRLGTIKLFGHLKLWCHLFEFSGFEVLILFLEFEKGIFRKIRGDYAQIRIEGGGVSEIQKKKKKKEKMPKKAVASKQPRGSSSSEFDIKTFVLA